MASQHAFVLSVAHVSKRFGRVEAVCDVSFQIQKGELFGLIGPDGAGKTTLLRMIATVLLPDTGTIRLLEYDAVKDYREIRCRLGYMPGRFSLYPDLTVEENLTFYATVFGTTIEENYSLISSIYKHLEPFKDRLARNLSGGMKQKLALCCALIHRPDFLILDEPTTGVDPVSRKEFWETLSQLVQHGITVLVSTPYMDEANLCHRVALMQNGKMMIIDQPSNIIASFPKPLVRITHGDAYSLYKDLQEYIHTDSVHVFGHEVHYTDKQQQPDLVSLRKFLDIKGYASASIEMITPSVEDCFMHYMGKSKMQA